MDGFLWRKKSDIAAILRETLSPEIFQKINPPPIPATPTLTALLFTLSSRNWDAVPQEELSNSYEKTLGNRWPTKFKVLYKKA